VDDERYGLVERGVDELLGRLERIGDDEAGLLADAWSREDQRARESGWRRAKPAIERDGLGGLLEEARQAVIGWASATRADFSGIEGLLGREGAQVHPRRQAMPAVLDAIVAVLAREVLEAAEHEALWRPWATATERSPGSDGTADFDRAI
jgi:hypothetical protein